MFIMSNNSEIQNIENLAHSCEKIKLEDKLVIGQTNVINKILITILSGGHAVLIGVLVLPKHC